MLPFKQLLARSCKKVRMWRITIQSLPLKTWQPLIYLLYNSCSDSHIICRLLLFSKSNSSMLYSLTIYSYHYVCKSSTQIDCQRMAILLSVVSLRFVILGMTLKRRRFDTGVQILEPPTLTKNPFLITQNVGRIKIP